jgi:hypothetical protein
MQEERIVTIEDCYNATFSIEHKEILKDAFYQPLKFLNIAEESIEEIRKSNWPEEISQNISFDIYWHNNEYTGIHNYRLNNLHLQNRYSGYLKIDISQLTHELAIDTAADVDNILYTESAIGNFQKD